MIRSRLLQGCVSGGSSTEWRGLQETKISDSIDRNIDGTRLLTFPPSTPARGLGFCIGKRFAPFLVRAWLHPHTERIATVVFRFPLPKGQHFELRVINVYAPTSPDALANPQERDKLYDLLGKSFSEFKHARGLTIVLGDFNAKVGRRRQGELSIGRFTAGQRNENGIALTNFAEAHSLLLANTCFCHPSRHITTWTGTTKQGRLIYNQIDYIALPMHYKASLQQARAYAGISTNTDHKMVCANIQLQHARILWGRGKSSARIAPFRLENLEGSKQQFNEATRQSFLAKSDNPLERTLWDTFCSQNQNLPSSTLASSAHQSPISTSPSSIASSPFPHSALSLATITRSTSPVTRSSPTPPSHSAMPQQLPVTAMQAEAPIPKRDRRPHFALPTISWPRTQRVKKPATTGEERMGPPATPTHSTPVTCAVSNPQRTLECFVGALTSAAETTIGRAPKKQLAAQDATLAHLSAQQKELRLRINNTAEPTERKTLRRQRMLLLRAVHRRALQCASACIDELICEIENAKDNTQCFLATRQLRVWRPTRLIIHDEQGREVKRDQEKAEIIAQHFKQIFLAPPGTLPLSPFMSPPCSLQQPISVVETAQAIAKLKCRRAPGPDGVPAELLKACTFAAPMLTHIFNQAFERNCPIQLGHGTIVPLPKPGKPPGPCRSLRPVTLLTAVRKVLSLIVVCRARPRFEAKLPSGQAGARPARSTADGVWTKRIMIAIVTHFHLDLHSLGTDISQAFDAVDRHTLLTFFEADGWMSRDECRITCLLLTNTTLQVRVGCVMSGSFTSSRGTIQGDALSTLIFIGYLAGALKNVKKAIHSTIPSVDTALGLPLDTSYVDDVDHHSISQEHLEHVLAATNEEFPKWSLQLNIPKTERMRFFIAPTKEACIRCSKSCRSNATCCDVCSSWWHNACAGIPDQQFQQFLSDPSARWVCQTCVSGDTPTCRGEESWRKCKHLGTLLDTASDVARRIQLANSAFATLNRVWLRKELVAEKKRVQLFKAFVLPHLTYAIRSWHP